MLLLAVIIYDDDDVVVVCTILCTGVLNCSLYVNIIRLQTLRTQRLN